MSRGTLVLSALAAVLAATFAYVFIQYRNDRDHRAILSEAKREWDGLAW